MPTLRRSPQVMSGSKRIVRAPQCWNAILRPPRLWSRRWGAAAEDLNARDYFSTCVRRAGARPMRPNRWGTYSTWFCQWMSVKPEYLRLCSPSSLRIYWYFFEVWRTSFVTLVASVHAVSATPRREPHTKRSKETPSPRDAIDAPQRCRSHQACVRGNRRFDVQRCLSTLRISPTDRSADAPAAGGL